MMLLLNLIVCVLFCFQGAFAADSLKSVFIQYVMDCNHDHPVTTQELELLRNHKFSDSKNTKCLQACVFKKTKWMNSKGMFDDEVAFNTSQKEFTDSSKLDGLRSLFTECKKVNDITFEGADSNCERASALAKCLSEHSVKLGFFDVM